MTSTLNPYLNFDGQAREALDFYRGVLGGELQLSTFGEYGDPAAPGADRIMHGRLETPDGFTLMVADLPPGETQAVGSNIAISLSGDDSEALRGYFTGLGDGGTVTVPLEKQMWGDEFGMLTDRFGIGWMVNVAGDAA